ncbi:MAG: hypothetical protein ABUT20_35570 [Bacteroidota bacterium]
MIEQTPLVVNEWIYMPPSDLSDGGNKIVSHLSFDVMKKRTLTKKGIACRFSCRFTKGIDTVLLYVAEDSYVIDIADVIDKTEVLRMIRNSYSKFKEKFDLRKMGTVVQDIPLSLLEEHKIDINSIVPLLL